VFDCTGIPFRLVWRGRVAGLLPARFREGLVLIESGTPSALAQPNALPEWLARVSGLDPIGYLARHSRSFRFATRFMAGKEARRIAEIYAFCRFTDDLVDRDEGVPAGELEARLDRWEALAEAAYSGAPTGSPVLDGPIGSMGRAGIPFAYARALIEGMRMDLRPRRYATLAELEVYTYRAAGTVGQWLAERAGVTGAWALARAADLGHAMQLTNILRDVGEDLGRGRIYLPLDLMAKHGLSERDLEGSAAWAGDPPAAYRALIEEMMDLAESRYQRAFQAIPALPRSFQRPVFVAALVYRGIHAAIRRNGYDNIGKRGRTGAGDKLAIAFKATWMLASLRELFPERRAAMPASAAPAWGPSRALAAARSLGLALALSLSCLRAGAVSAGTRDAGSEPPQTRAEVASRMRAEMESAEARIHAFPDSSAPRLDRLRVAYALGVSREDYLGQAGRDADWLEARAGGDRARLNLVRAYRGAILVAHAKHGFNLNRKMRLLKAAAPILDSAVAAEPEGAEVRYLRLVSGYYLPFFLGRKAAVREDFAALARILPGVTDRFPPRFYLSVAGFVRDEGDLDAQAGARLSRAIEAVADAIPKDPALDPAGKGPARNPGGGERRTAR
jgi:phytoene synthase